MLNGNLVNRIRGITSRKIAIYYKRIDKIIWNISPRNKVNKSRE